MALKGLKKVSFEQLKKEGRDWVPIREAARLEGIGYQGMVGLIRRGKREAVNMGTATMVIPIIKKRLRPGRGRPKLNNAGTRLGA